MLFNSVSYLIFLPIVFLVYWILPPKHRWTLLLAASYYFYMSWNAKYVVLIMAITLISYGSARILSRHRQYKRLCIAIAVIVSLGVLVTFKYLDFLFEILNTVFLEFAIPLHVPTLTLLLPVGISFYTFQALSYVIDVYRGDVEAELHFGKYATFISFFPQLVAGPIERSKNLLPQIRGDVSFHYEKAVYGILLMAWGFFQKVIIADTVASKVNMVYDNLESYGGLSLIIVCFLFSIQIYCDFGGYSNIAIGTAKLLGIDLITNFKSPYLAVTITDFWNRWHISLSTWFRDYLYIPLGGNRCKLWKNQLNVLITFLASGLWHGANYTFVLWGGIHGVLQIGENLLIKKEEATRVPSRTSVRIVRMILMFCMITFTWVFFRAQSIDDMKYVFTHWTQGIQNPVSYIKNGVNQLFYTYEILQVAIPCLLLVVFDYFNYENDTIQLVLNQSRWVRWLIYIAFVFICFICYPYVTSTEFIYFQF